MQVISGNLRGLMLESVKNDYLRPTKDRVKKSIFDILRFQTENNVFLDLFGGTGQIGIEAFSQGFNKVIIVEKSKKNAAVINKNLKKIKIPNSIELLNMDALDFLSTFSSKADVIFLDPPYKEIDLLNRTLNSIATLKFPPELIIVETLSSQSMPEKIQKFYLRKIYNYGRISLNLYEIKEL